jgi:biopolymer transport protein ExbB
MEMHDNAPKKNNAASIFAWVIIPLSLVISILIFVYVLGAAHNFDEEGHPVNLVGTMHEGGPVVPVLMSCFLIALTVSIERMIVIMAAVGKGNLDNFVRNVKGSLMSNKLDEAMALCDEQRGSVGNVVHEVLKTYKKVLNDKGLSRDKKLEYINKELEDAAALEMPALERNMGIVATLASVSTLLALFGTVLGMIRAFMALAASGTPDPQALSTGISEALINTALGIFTSAISIIAYNFLTARVDNLTHKIDEVGYVINQHFLMTPVEKEEKSYV